ncbi:MAG: undecaprenyl-phosphate glucose phosphotransferase [Kiritimatiellia bacterium]|jgi:exopolysaccharide biosynthesis polyprenyl glycosylphosphotransferase|nr:undecaprenyl-phosphate glucose phosphotransferase [Kiritimatiellia bacterium]MDP6847958.1 undecaprenyl-phosphate glucose phosphotransferase [Kiritimatiellia bacterium]
MPKRDTSDVLASLVAVICDASAIFGGFMLATWIRFDSGWLPDWVPVAQEGPDPLYSRYLTGAAVATSIYLLIFRSLGLFMRPQTGRFPDKIPRLVRATLYGILSTAVLVFVVQNNLDFSRIVVGLAFFCILFLVTLERYILYRIEWNVSRHTKEMNHVLMIGTDSVAVHLKRTFRREAMLRLKVIGFMRTDASDPNPAISDEEIKGSLEDLPAFIENNRVDQIVLTSSQIPHERVVDIIMLCERNLITFNMVPDLFRILTGSMDVQSIDDIPLLGVSEWPLDLFWNRMLKRFEDLAGAFVGLIISAPVIAVAALIVKRSSPGPIFFKQERCGEHGKPFSVIKLRTMYVDAEAKTGPVFTKEDDPRVTKVGSFLRRMNIDELPQFWNVMKGEMSLVGPRPERPHFVEKFKEEIGSYMWRHVSKPGLTGWAQVNGLRGNTSIEERIKYDLYYLENWSTAFDFKILLRTFFARENAY